MAKLSEGHVMNDGKFFAPPIYATEPARVARTPTKRAFDIVVSVTILLFIAPVMAAIWAMVRLDGGSGFYGHPRVGQGGRLFRCLKFRTMVTNSDAVLQALLAKDPRAREEWERSQKLLKDPRVTRIGRFLRATSLDELPQLFNVVRGDMSLVGPRPVVRSEIDRFYHGADRMAYLSVRPGVTGLWQVSGRSNSSYDQRVRLDREYVHKASFGFDLVILFKTVVVVLRRHGAY